MEGIGFKKDCVEIEKKLAALIKSWKEAVPSEMAVEMKRMKMATTVNTKLFSLLCREIKK